MTDATHLDTDRITQLLVIEEKTRALPRLKAIHDAALAELELHAQTPEKESTDAA
jgi:hypothetical protein